MKKILTFAFILSLLAAGVWLLARPGQPLQEGVIHEQAIGRLAAANRATTSNRADSAAPSGAVKPVLVYLEDVAPGSGNYVGLDIRWREGLIDLEREELRPPALMAQLREEAADLPVASAVQQPAAATALNLDRSFAAMDVNDCCNVGSSVPPDPELAVGPNHIIAVVNVAFEIYDKSGVVVQPATTFSDLFATAPAGISNSCKGTGPFDPNVLYDEQTNRFFMAVDGNGASYCVAVSKSGNPVTGGWYLYEFPTNVNGNFFDFPHAGVGRDAIYMGANLFFQSGNFAEARVWAFDKADLYAGRAADYQSKSVGDDDTPQPLNLHGYQQGTWPLFGPHYFIASRNFNGATFALYSWNNPFGGGPPQVVAVLDLPADHGIDVGMPVTPLQDGDTYVAANDFRPLDFEYRDGSGWTTMTVSCNPGGGSTSCVQWAEIDLGSRSVVQSGVFGSNGDYRFFPDLAVNGCGDAAIGYSISNSGSWPGIAVAAREASDPAGAMPGELTVKAGETQYTSFDASGSVDDPFRWGDYSGMTIDPDGKTFWYLGEYSKQVLNSARWGTYVAALSFDCQPVVAPPPNIHTSFLPLINRAADVQPPPPSNQLENGDFEQGPAVWDSQSALGQSLIRTGSELGTTPRSGTWAARFGGENDEAAHIGQYITVSDATPTLRFWYRTDSSEYVCQFDFWSVALFNSATDTVPVAATDDIPLCIVATRDEWTEVAIDLTAYAGQRYHLRIRATTDYSNPSTLFVDDVSFAAAATSQQPLVQTMVDWQERSRMPTPEVIK